MSGQDDRYFNKINFINYIKAFDDMRVFLIFYGIYRDISSLI